MERTCTEAQIKHQQLTLRYQDADDGRRPIPGCRFWRSPDLWIDHGGDSTVGLLSAALGPGAVNRVTARVTNMTSDATFRGINVEAWICHHTSGPAGPTTQIASAGSFPRTGFHPGPLAPGQSVVIACDPSWVPDTPGSCCLVANCWADDPPDGHPLVGSLDFCCDAHHARRNGMVVSFAVGFPEPGHGGGGGFGALFTAVNPDQQAREFVMQIVPVQPGEFGAGDAEFVRSLLEEEVVFQPSLPGETINFGINPNDGSPGGHEFTVRLGPGEQRDFVVGAGHSDVHQPVGRVYTFDIIQRGTDGEVVGGFPLYIPIIHGPQDSPAGSPVAREPIALLPLEAARLV